MTSRSALSLIALALIALLALPMHVAARAPQAPQYPYIAIDTGTLGGPSAHFGLPGQVVTNRGMVLVQADTPVSDTDYMSATMVNFLDGYMNHAAVWHNGVLSDLGALSGPNSSVVFEVNAQGWGAGVSENGALDPLLGYPEGRAVVWTPGHLLDLGTLGGNESLATWINESGQVVGMTTNATPDPFTLDTWATVGTQMRAFLWQNGHTRDLGTLGGPDSAADFVNARGQVAGNSFTTAIPNAVTGLPTEDPFLWTDGHMQDLGTLGGTRGYPTIGGPALNDRGEVIGASDLPGDLTSHAFLWDGTSMKDLGTFGGSYSEPGALNEAGDVVGIATTPGDVDAHAFLWKNGVLTDLDGATSTRCDYANSLNAQDQVVGGSCGPSADGWLWDHGTLSDLNTLVAPSAVQLTQAWYINDRGEIADAGVLANGDLRVILLVPTGLAEREGLVSNMPAPSASGFAPVIHGTPMACLTTPLWRARQMQGCGRFRRGA
jgi:probable HAF family extracellular repeat protein